MFHRLLILIVLIFIPACTPKTQPAQVFPGFQSAAGDSMATIRESDRVYLKSIDGKPSPERSGSILGRDLSYHQYQVPAGMHDVVVFFDSGESDSPRGGPGLSITIYANRQGSLGLADITLHPTLMAGQSYAFTSGVSKFYLKFGSGNSTAKWNPTLIDDTTKAPAAATTQPTTAPAGK